ncbi:MAG: hypothetical protein OEY33_02415 [Bdellovibrionales bacterium]|nr:hypothetical protein [Bdellovibrionales bacterium]
MDLILSIFKRLDLDITILYQFVITVLLFVILNQVLFKKLLEVLRLRESKTEGLENEANSKLKRADEMAKQYKDKIDGAFSEAQEDLKNKKKAIKDQLQEEVKGYTLQKSNEAEEQMVSFKEGFESKKDSIVLKADELSKDLVNKLVQ